MNTIGMTQLMYFKKVMTDRAWYKLVPDYNTNLIIAGYGSYDSFGPIGANTYTTAAMSPNGDLAMAYTPVATTLTVAMTNFSGSVTSQWYDPSAGTFSTISGSTSLAALHHSGMTQAPAHSRRSPVRLLP